MKGADYYVSRLRSGPLLFFFSVRFVLDFQRWRILITALIEQMRGGGGAKGAAFWV